MASKSKFTIELVKLLEHVQKCQYVLLGVTFSVFLLAASSPEPPPALQQLKQVEIVLNALGDRWIDNYLKSLQPSKTGLTREIEVTSPAGEKISVENPIGLFVDQSFSQNVTYGLSTTATALMMRDGLGLFTDYRKRGIPPLWVETKDLLKIRKLSLEARMDAINKLTLNDVNDIWSRYKGPFQVSFVEKIIGQFVPIWPNQVLVNPVVISVDKTILNASRKEVNLTEPAPNEKIGQLWFERENWKIPEIGSKSPGLGLIEVWPNDLQLNRETAVYFLVQIDEQNTTIFDPLAKELDAKDIEVKSSFQQTFPDLSSIDQNKKDLTLLKLESDLKNQTSQPDKAVEADVLGIKIEGLHVWWLLPLVIFLVQMYFLVHLFRLEEELKNKAGNLKDLHPLGMIYPGRWPAFLGWAFIVAAPPLVTLFACCALKFTFNEAFSQFYRTIVIFILVLVASFFIANTFCKVRRLINEVYYEKS